MRPNDKRLRRHPLSERLWARADRNGPVPAHRPELGPCWLWTGAIDSNGYGRIGLGGKYGRTVLTSRAAFFVTHGRWPDPCVLHRCDNPTCVRPEHLFEGTLRDNTADMLAKGRHVTRASEYAGERNGNAKLTNEQRNQLRKARSEGTTYAALGSSFGISKQAAIYICKRGIA